MIEKVWKIENGIGHWNIYVNGEFVCSCDDGELSAIIEEIEKGEYDDKTGI